MANLNRVYLMGNLTRDVELKYLPNGKAVADLSLAINRTYKTESGEKHEETTFVDVTFFGRPAEIAAEYLKKGSPTFVDGRLEFQSWEDKQTGQKRSKLKVIGDNLQLIGGKQ